MLNLLNKLLGLFNLRIQALIPLELKIQPKESRFRGLDLSGFEKCLYYLVRYGLFFSPFIALIIFRNFWSPFFFGKAIVFRMLIEILIIAYVPLAIRYKEFRPPKNLVLWGLLFFVFSYALSSFFGVSFYTSFWSDFERMGGLFTFLHYFALFVLITGFLEKEEVMLVIKISILASIVSSIYGFVQKFNFEAVVGADSRFRILGTMGNPAQFAGYLIFNIYFALFFFFQNFKNNGGKGVKIFYASAVTINSIAVLMTSVRGSALALFPTLFLCLLIYFYKTEPERQKIILGAGFAIILIIALGFIFNNSRLINNNDYLSRLFNIDFKERDIVTRLVAWKAAIQGFEEKPVFGWGQENFTAVFGKYYDPKIYQGTRTEHIFDRPHNIFLNTAATQGIIGLFSLFFLWGSASYFIFKQKNMEFLALKFLIIAYFIHNSFIFNLTPTYLMMIYFLGLVSLHNGAGRRPVPEKKPAKTSRKLYLASRFSFIVILIINAFLFFRFNIQSALANFYSTRGFVFFSKGDYFKGLEYSQKALSFPTHPKTDVRRKFDEAYLNIIYNRQLPQNVQPKDIENNLLFLIKEFDDEIKKDSEEFVSYVYTAKTYQALGVFIDKKYFDQAEDYIKKALATSPNMPNLYQDLAGIKNLKGEYKESMDIQRIAYDLNHSFPESQYLYGRTLISYGQGINDKTVENKGIETIMNSFIRGHEIEEDLRWFSGFLEKRKDFGRLIRLYSSLSLREAYFYAQLAYSYLLNGNLAEAQFFADKAMEVKNLPKSFYGILATVYKQLGNNKKRTEALEKSGAF